MSFLLGASHGESMGDVGEGYIKRRMAGGLADGMALCLFSPLCSLPSRHEQRQKEMESELSASCPEHTSKWMLAVDHVEKEAAMAEKDQ